MIHGRRGGEHCERQAHPPALESWDRTWRAVGKAEWTNGEANPRFIVTSLKSDEAEARHLYEAIYCVRGEMENCIKACQLALFADRPSAATMRANQLRLCFASMAQVPLWPCAESVSPIPSSPRRRAA